jgi:hypothetical protein
MNLDRRADNLPARIITSVIVHGESWSVFTLTGNARPVIAQTCHCEEQSDEAIS